MTDQVVSLGPTGNLSGVVTYPEGNRATEWGAVLLNAGTVHRVGPNRLYVQVARALAPLDFSVLRFDFSSIGESPGRDDQVPFERRGVEEVRQAMDWLASHQGCRKFLLMGLCSGAEIAFKTACQDPRVAAGVLLNAPRYHTEPSPEVLAQVARNFEANYYWRAARFDRQRWIKLLKGRVNFTAIARGVWSKLHSVLARNGNGTTAAPDVMAFEELLRRDVRLLLLFSEGDWGFDYLQTVLGKHVEEWRDRSNPTLEVVPRSDHMLTPLVSQQRALRVIVEWARDMANSGFLASSASLVYGD